MTITETLMHAFQLSSEEAAIFLSGFSKIHLKKNETFILSGKVCHKIGLIEQGLMKCVFDKGGTELISNN